MMPYQDQVTQRKFEVAASSAPKKISKIQFGNEQWLKCDLTMNQQSTECMFSEVGMYAINCSNYVQSTDQSCYCVFENREVYVSTKVKICRVIDYLIVVKHQQKWPITSSTSLLSIFHWLIVQKKKKLLTASCSIRVIYLSCRSEQLYTLSLRQ